MKKKGSANYKNSKFTKIVDAIDYIPNRMMGFIKNNKSFHSVGPLNWPKNEYRDALLFNISGVDYKPKGQKKKKAVFMNRTNAP